MANPSNTRRGNFASGIRTLRQPPIRHMKTIFRGGLQIANTALSIPIGSKITIRRK